MTDYHGEPVNECANGWGYYDLGLQNENFVLKAKESGLDTLIMGIRDGEAIREFLNVPETEQVVSVIAVGYAAKDSHMPKLKKCFGHNKVLLNNMVTKCYNRLNTGSDIK